MTNSLLISLTYFKYIFLILLYMPYNVFNGNTYKYILTGIDVPSRYKVARALNTKKSSKVVNLGNNIDKKRRATHFIWSKNTYRLDRIVQKPGKCVLYSLQDGTDRVFVHEELMHISEDTQVPPEWVSEWKYHA